MIEVTALTKRFGSKTALDDISFTVGEGEVLGFLGPNGAGKSTAMNIITGYLSSACGTVTIGGHEILAEPMKAKAQIGYLPEHPPLYLDMTVWEYLSFLFALKRLRLPKRAHIEETCELVGVAHVTGRRLGNLSKGYRQRVGLAQALLGNPPVLILDEPTVGLDPKQIIEIRSLIRSLGKRHTVILSSHILPEVQAVCERVIVINEGRIIADGTPDNLSRGLGGEGRLTARIAGPEQEVGAFLAALPGVSKARSLGPREENAFDWLLETEPGGDIRPGLFFALAGKGWPLLALRGSDMSLEDIFLSLIAGD